MTEGRDGIGLSLQSSMHIAFIKNELMEFSHYTY